MSGDGAGLLRVIADDAATATAHRALQQTESRVNATSSKIR